MSLELICFFLMLLANVLIVLVYIVFNLLRSRKKEEHPERSMWFRSVVMLLCPVVGACFFLIGHVIYRIFFRTPVDLEDVIFSKERVKTYSYADEEQERNIVPLEDAIAVSDTDSLRSLMMNVVRGDVQDSLATISLALDSEDSETSHYAAAVLQEALDKFRADVQKGYQMILEDPKGQAEYAAILFDYMNPVLLQKVFTDIEQMSMVHMMDEIGDALYENSRSSLTSAQIEAVTLRLLEVSDYENCRKWCERAEYMFPNELATYTCQLKLFFNTGKRNQFFRVLGDLRDSDIIVDNETLELIRVFL